MVSETSNCNCCNNATSTAIATVFPVHHGFSGDLRAEACKPLGQRLKELWKHACRPGGIRPQ